MFRATFLVVFLFLHLSWGATEDAPETSVPEKLDRILNQLNSLNSKYQLLNKTLSEKLCSCHENEIHHLSKPNFRGGQSRHLGLVTYNKLASDSNDITGESTNANKTKVSDISTIHDSLENLGIILRDQLASFRSTLFKLMNRLWDQSYQLDQVNSQLSSVKDECSTSISSWSSFAMNATHCPASSYLPEGQPNRVDPSGAMRTSQVILIKKLVAQEVNEVMDLIQANISAFYRSISEQQTRDSENQALRMSFMDEQVKSVGSKLEEISSVVKQSASILSKTQSLPTGEPLVVTVDNETPNSNLNDREIKSTQKPNSRWYPGSKTPGKNKTDVGLMTALTVDGDSKTANLKSCVSKTSLIKPSSCQELRLAGANCSGQYYVFVQSSIMHVYCDMNMDSNDNGGGWTVILRRLDKSIWSANDRTGLDRPQRQSPSPFMEQLKASQTNFSLDLINYRRGFGQLNDWAEFFIGLDLLHHLSSRDTNYELQIDMESRDSSELKIKFDSFSVGGEDDNFRLQLGTCNDTQPICAPISQLNMSEFRLKSDLDGPDSSWAWWGSSNQIDSRADLTRPFKRLENGSMNHFYWPNWSHSSEPLKRIVMKIRERR